MKKLYNKSPLAFALVMIGFYVVLMSLFDSLSLSIGKEHLISALASLIASAALVIWIFRQKLNAKFGLTRPVCTNEALYYIPLIVVTLQNVYFGAVFEHDLEYYILYIIKMLSVGFLEEVIFRGFLFKAMSENNVKSAVLVSSITFGIGHIVNLFNSSGMNIADNLIQVVMAALIGFMYVLLFIKTKSLVPCIVSHGVFNSLSAFSYELSITQRICTYRITVLIALAYCIILVRSIKRDKKESA